ncbi:hypothetical protein Pyn_03426 [Prunus yedoensis var. nudiflora]|uniref:Uncharacterized protein n=1 Tax=Prunus yedoensis var. nudiflora TaxID=2094558 RepID=A0A314YU45_PRUYE|nr:hypothetical protein Pyn_03426 [Prunus yedoensis var. nudiflora]
MEKYKLSLAQIEKKKRTYNTGHGGGGSGLSNTIDCLARGDLYGHELISWAATSTSFSDQFPISSKTLKSHGKVEVFAIRAIDLLFIVRGTKQRPHPTDNTHIEITDHGNA